MNTEEGLVGYKGLTPDQANQLVSERPAESNGPLTLILAEPGTNIGRIANNGPPPKPSSEEALALLLDSLHMLRQHAV